MGVGYRLRDMSMEMSGVRVCELLRVGFLI